MRILEAYKKDRSEIAEIEYTCGNRKIYGYKSKKDVEHMFKKYCKKSKFFILKQKNKILGYITLNKFKNKGEIAYIAIRKKYQGKSFGTKLIKFAERYFKKLKCNKIVLSLFAKNFKALLTYTKNKFYVTKAYKRKGRPRLDMQKDL